MFHVKNCFIQSSNNRLTGIPIFHFNTEHCINNDSKRMLLVIFKPGELALLLYQIDRTENYLKSRLCKNTITALFTLRFKLPITADIGFLIEKCAGDLQGFTKL